MSATTFCYTYHASDALAVKKRTTTLPKIKGVGDTPNENGAGLGQPAGTVSDYFETDGLNTWSEDGDTFVHYTGYDASRRTVTKRVKTSTPHCSLPAGVPAPPTGEGFDTPSGGGLNLVTDWEYDLNRRLTKVSLAGAQRLGWDFCGVREDDEALVLHEALGWGGRHA